MKYLLLITFLITSVFSIAQDKEPITAPSLGHEIEAGMESQQEELHRYMGYERLLPKYISLPYDVNVNTNVQGSYVEISYLYLMFIPIILIIGIKNVKWKLFSFFLLMLFYLMSNTTGYSAFNKISVFEAPKHIKQVLGVLSFSESPLMLLKLKITQLFTYLYMPLDRFIAPISGEGDTVTLPLLVLLFTGILCLIWRQFAFSSTTKKVVAYFSMLYGFQWLILSAGVPWYGMLLIGLGLIVIGVYYFSLEGRNKLFTKFFLAFSCIWFLFAYTSRFGDYDLSSTGNHLGAINTASLIYSTGKYNEQEVMDLLYTNYSKALAEINRDPSVLVYRIGTFMHYFIERNHERVIEDNQLGNFNALYTIFPDKQELARKLKESNCRYIILDLNTATIDATADKSLTKKYERMLDFIRGNPAIEMIATDRIIKDGKLEKNGSFAAFKIN